MLAERVKQWTQEWEKRGEKRGRKQGEIEMLRRQLTRKFGHINAQYEQRIDQAQEHELLCWSERILEAETIEVIFAPIPG